MYTDDDELDCYDDEFEFMENGMPTVDPDEPWTAPGYEWPVNEDDNEPTDEEIENFLKSEYPPDPNAPFSLSDEDIEFIKNMKW